MSFLRNILALFCTFVLSTSIVFAEARQASMDIAVHLPAYLKIQPVMSPVLTANITNRSGNLNVPLISRFKVITNAAEEQTLYLQAHTVTQGGYESAMFIQGGQVYIAFANLTKLPTSQSLANCKMGARPEDSPRVVAYPITSIDGANTRFVPEKEKYEVYVGNGETYVTVNVGSHVLRNSFASNDPKGFYQSVLSLTEVDI